MCIGVTIEFDRQAYFVYEGLGNLSACVRINTIFPLNNLNPGVDLLLETIDNTASK